MQFRIFRYVMRAAVYTRGLHPSRSLYSCVQAHTQTGIRNSDGNLKNFINLNK